MTLTPTQQLHLSRVRTAHAAYREAKAFAGARAKALVDEEVRAYLAARDHEVVLAFSAGLKKAFLGREGLGTSDYRTVDDIIKKGEQVAAISRDLPSDPLADAFIWDSTRSVLTIRVPADEFADSIARSDWHQTVELATSSGFDSFELALKTRPDGSQYLNPAATTTCAEWKYNLHPAYLWWSRGSADEQAARELEAITWINA